MLSLHRTLSLRYLRQRWSRTALVVISIALGVTLVVATRLLSQSMKKAANAAATPLSGTADLMVQNGETGIDGAVVARLRTAAIPGVREVRPLVIGDAGILYGDGRPVLDAGDRPLRPKLLGVELDRIHPPADGENGQPADSSWKVHCEFGLPHGAAEEEKSGLAVFTRAKLLQFLEGRRLAFAGKELANRLADLEPKEDPKEPAKFLITSGGKRRKAFAVGTITAEGPASFLGGNVLIMDLDDASALVFGDQEKAGYVYRIDMVLEEGSDPEQVRQAVQQVLGNRYLVVTPQENNQAIQQITGGLEAGFTLSGAVALVLGLFLVYIMLAVSVAERRHDIGVLRSMGATRLQVAGLFAGEAALLGFTGAALGVPLGWAAAVVAMSPIQKILSDVFLPLEVSSTALTLDVVVLALTAGVATALLAALVPALQAASQEPADAVRRVPPRYRRGFFLLWALLCGVVLAAGLALIALREHLPQRVGGYGGIQTLFVGLLLVTPLLASWLGRLLQPLARLVLGLQGRLAADNLLRAPGRTGLVIAVLAAGVALILHTVGVNRSTEQAALDWIDTRFAADLFVTSFSPVTAGGSALPMDADVGRQIAEDPELKGKIDAVVPVRIHELPFRNEKVLMIAFDSQKAEDAVRDRGHAPNLDLYPRLREAPGDHVLVSDNFAALYDVHPGDTLEVLGKEGQPVVLRVVGTVTDYTWNRGTILIDRQSYLDRIGDTKVDLFHVYVHDGRQSDTAAHEVQEIIGRKWGLGTSDSDKGLCVLTREELREGVRGLLRRLNAIAYAQELVVALVVGLGVVAALLISVLQRRRELGLLRAVGASQGQVLLSVLAEAVLMGLIGALIGLAAGLPLEWFVIRFLLLDETGFVFPMVVPWLAVAGVGGAALLLAVLAGLLPALRAMQLPIAEAIAYE